MTHLNNREALKNSKNNPKMNRALRGLWNYKKNSNIHVVRVPKGEEKRVRLKKYSNK